MNKQDCWLETYFCRMCDCVFYIAWSHVGAEQINECPNCGVEGERII